MKGIGKTDRLSCLLQVSVIAGMLFVLAAIAIPDFLKFQARAKCSESKTNLGAIFTTQVAYFGEHGTYAGSEECFKLLGWSPEGATIYNYICDSSVIRCNKKGCEEIYPPFATDGTGAGSAKDGFTIMAVGNIDRDETLDVWIINDAKKIGNVVNDVAN